MPFELELFGTLSISGPRPGEIYLDVEKPYFRIVRTWCSKGCRFYTPQAEDGRRTVPISAWLPAVLREHRATSGGVELVFPSTAGTPLNKANVRKRVWMPLLEQAQVRYRYIYSLRLTFVIRHVRAVRLRQRLPRHRARGKRSRGDGLHSRASLLH